MQNLQKEIASDSISVCVHCPTCWRVRAEALTSILFDEVLFKLWDEAKQVISDTETIESIHGVFTYMEKLSFLHGLCGEIASESCRADSISRTLQVNQDTHSNWWQEKAHSLSRPCNLWVLMKYTTFGGRKVTKMAEDLTVKTLQSMSTDEIYDFWRA